MTILAFVAIVVTAEPKFKTQEIEKNIRVGYAVRIADINADKKPDIVVLDGDQVLWYENPKWEKHQILKGQTIADNVCFAVHDVNGDGKLDLAIGADWAHGSQTATNLHWLEQTEPTKPWKLHAIGNSPFVHRMLWEDVTGDQKPELIVVPLLGPGKSQAEGRKLPVTITAYPIPENPSQDRWKPIVVYTKLHVTHNFLFADLDGTGKRDLVVTSFEGLTQFKPVNDDWQPAALLTKGDQSGPGNLGCSEVAYGKPQPGNMLATIEPWHGNQVVVYARPSASEKQWRRTVVDSEFEWGHAIHWADLDGDGADELIAGIRNDKKDSRCGVRVYRVNEASNWKRQLVDPGGVAVEDMAIGDLDGDGRPDIVVSGRQTHNARIYWNKK